MSTKGFRVLHFGICHMFSIHIVSWSQYTDHQSYIDVKTNNLTKLSRLAPQKFKLFNLLFESAIRNIALFAN